MTDIAGKFENPPCHFCGRAQVSVPGSGLLTCGTHMTLDQAERPACQTDLDESVWGSDWLYGRT